jgi:hypothetical protein
MKKVIQSLLAVLTVASVHAVPFTEISPTSEGALPTGTTKVGGIVFDAVGLNGNRLVAQKAAGSLFVGYATSNPQVIGTQTGMTSGLLSLLGGGFSELAVRVTLSDGDSAAGNFDYNSNTFLINGFTIGNWSSVNALSTNAAGTTSGTFSGGGFRDNTLDTGWFYTTNTSLLSSVYSSIFGSGQVVYSLNDISAGDNYYDFTQGVDGGLINTEVAPTVSAVPDGGSTFLLLGSAMVGLVALRRKLVALTA